MNNLIERFKTVELKQTCPLDTIGMNINYQFLSVSNIDVDDDDDGRGARVVLWLKLGDNTLGPLYMTPDFTNVFTLSDKWNIINDRVRYDVIIVKFDDAQPRNLLLESDEL